MLRHWHCLPDHLAGFGHGFAGRYLHVVQRFAKTEIAAAIRYRVIDSDHKIYNNYFENLNGSGYGGYQAILKDHKNKTYRAASESRKDGHAAGY